jgi:ribonuclease E
MADDLQAEETAPSSPAAEEPAKKAAAKKAPAKKAAAKKAPAKKAAAKKTAPAADSAAEPAAEPTGDGQLDLGVDAPPSKKTSAVKAAKRAPAKKAAAKKTGTARTAAKKTAAVDAAPAETPAEETAATALLFQAPDAAKKAPARRTRKTAAAAPVEAVDPVETPDAETPDADSTDGAEETKQTPRKRSSGGRQGGRSGGRQQALADQPADEDETEPTDDDDASEGDEQSGDGNGPARRRRRRGGRRRRKPGDSNAEGDSDESDDSTEADDSAEDTGDESAAGGEDGSGDSPSSRRRRRRRRSGDDGGGEGGDDPENTVTRVRRQRSAEDEITSIQGSTRLEAKKQRRREGREAGRRRAPIASEAEFLARRESVDRVMVVRQREDLTQIGVLEDKVLVEHYVARASQTSLIGNVYLGRVQNVLPSMEAAFIDIGKGRNAVLYAGEVNWSALGHKDGQARKIESVLSSGQTILVQVSKDPIGHKGARLTSQVSLAGRFLVYVPDGTTSGISRKLPDTERNRLKTLLKEIVPDSAGVIVRTAAEGASEEELTRDVERLKARWEDIEGKLKGSAPQLLYGEPDLTLKVVRDLFTEDFSKLVIQGDDAWDTVQGYVAQVAPDLEERLERYEPGANGRGGKADVFAEYRIEEQIAKGLDRKVWLPSGGSLVIDRTEAMTVVDVNTGKFTGSGGNLEETVTKNNLEAAEEVVRQLRLRDIGGIIVVDFIDMVLESNRDLVLRRLVECLGRDRTRHQVAEVTSLGLVQMTRKRIGTGLVEAFSENCSHCQGRGVIIQDTPVTPKDGSDDEPRRGGGSGSGGRRGRGRGRGQDDGAAGNGGGNGGGAKAPSPKDVAAMARPENAEHEHDHEDDQDDTFDETPLETAPTELAVEAASVEETPVADAPAEPEQDSEPAPPKVTTRSRRRSAPRPAAEPAPVVVQAEPEPVTEPVVEEPVVEEPVVQAVAPPEPPKVITRTRGRAATRPAGPPVEVPAEDPVASTDDEDGEHPHIEHVPIKKKGSRKR